MGRKKITQKEPVKLRERKLSDGSISLYLDIYRNGKREREFLKLYLIDAKTPADKEQNRQTLATANAVKAKRTIELQNGEYSFTKQFKEDTPFLAYFRDLMESHRKGQGRSETMGSWRSVLHYLEKYCDESTTFKDVTPEFIMGFKKMLDTCEKDTSTGSPSVYEKDTFQGLAQNSKVLYFEKFRSCIKSAYENGVIAHNPLRGIPGFKRVASKREFLTLDEVKRLAATPCRTAGLKRAFLFSCLTGLRKSDIIKLTWGEVQKFGDFTRIVFRQKKTGGLEYLDISPQAEKYLGKRKDPEDRVFSDFRYGSHIGILLDRWCMNAGITKKITFHCGRHTFAVLMLDLGADIYTVSKLLGHSSVTITQVYAKVLDRNKQNAVSRIPDIG